MQAMGAYSIAGRDLRALLALLRPAADGASVPRHSPLLLSTLGAMAAHLGPAAFFDFGDGGAGIMRSAPLRCSIELSSHESVVLCELIPRQATVLVAA